MSSSIYSRFSLCLRFAAILSAALGLFSNAHSQTTPTFTQVIVFGDSLSDTGNVANETNDRYATRYPGATYNYDGGRFTNGADTDPGNGTYLGVWHEQLERALFNPPLPRAVDSRDGGTNYALAARRAKPARRMSPSFLTPILLLAANLPLP